MQRVALEGASEKIRLLVSKSQIQTARNRQETRHEGRGPLLNPGCCQGFAPLLAIAGARLHPALRSLSPIALKSAIMTGPSENSSRRAVAVKSRRFPPAKIDMPYAFTRYQPGVSVADLPSAQLLCAPHPAT
jgi:hypothetical protein